MPPVNIIANAFFVVVGFFLEMSKIWEISEKIFKYVDGGENGKILENPGKNSMVDRSGLCSHHMTYARNFSHMITGGLIIT